MKTALMLFALLGSNCLAQTAFEVAVIKPSPRVAGPAGMMTGVRIDKSQVSITSLSLETVLAMAYRVQPYLISGPDWLKTTAFNITAKLPDGAPVDRIPEMLQALFAERFKMTAHRETRDQPVYALVVAKGGLRLKANQPVETKDPPHSDAGTVLTPMGEMTLTTDPKGAAFSGKGINISMNAGRMRFELSTFAKLAQFLSTDVGRPVLDETNLQGTYPIAFELSNSQTISPQGPASDPASESPMFDSLRPLGIVVESKKTPVETIVIDHMEKAPTEN